MSFEKNSAFDPKWSKLSESDTEYYARLERQQRTQGSEDKPGRLERTAAVKTGMVEVPKGDLEDIVSVLRIAATALENEDIFLAEEVAEQVDRLTSYFKG